MKKLFVLFIAVVIATGCASVPFQETPPVSLKSVDPRSFVERFQANMPQNFQLLTSVVFEYNQRKFPAIGYVDISRTDRVFKVACLNPMGVKLFELSGNQNSVTTHYTIAAITQYGDISAAVGNDIRRIYFDLVPAPDAHVWKRKYQFIFSQFSGPGTMEYVFAGAGGDLIEKRYYEDRELVWKVSYYEYHEQNGKRYPYGIVFINYLYGYRLTVRQKELRA